MAGQSLGVSLFGFTILSACLSPSRLLQERGGGEESVCVCVCEGEGEREGQCWRRGVLLGQRGCIRSPSLAACLLKWRRAKPTPPSCLVGPERVQHQPVGGGVLPYSGILRQDTVFKNLLQRLPQGLSPVGAYSSARSMDRWGPQGRSPRPMESSDPGGFAHLPDCLQKRDPGPH